MSPLRRERAPCAWVLNLDAEHELEVGPRYAPSRRLAGIVAREREALIGTLVAPGDLVVDQALLEGVRPGELPAKGLPGQAWSPTPRARRLLERAGAETAPAPELTTLAAVNARPFAAGVRAALDPAADRTFAKHVARNLEAVLQLLAEPQSNGWLVRRTFGAAGRGRRRIAAGRPSSAELAWITASLRRGPLVLEPWVRITCEYTRSGWVGRDGSVFVARPCFQATTAHGAWTRTARAARGDVAKKIDQRLEQAADAAGRALAAAGYFGAFGVDAFSHRALDAPHEVLNPLSEINARFTMDWTTGLAATEFERFTPAY